MDNEKKTYWKTRILEKVRQMATSGHNEYIKDIQDMLTHAKLNSPEIQSKIDATGKAVDDLAAEIEKVKI